MAKIDFMIPGSNVGVSCGENCDACNYCDCCNQDILNPQYVEDEDFDDDYTGNMPCDTYGMGACTILCRNYAKCQGWE